VLFAVAHSLSASPTHFTQAPLKKAGRHCFDIPSIAGADRQRRKTEPGALTAVYRSLPFGTKVKVNKSNGRWSSSPSTIAVLRAAGSSMSRRAARALDLTD
jgi:hypothetical protein